MATRLDPPLVPRRPGRAPKVLSVARISNDRQDELSLEDQQALYEGWLHDHTDLPYVLTMIASRGTGECVDRKQALQATAEVETGGYDLVITEDLGRIFRRAHAQLFCELCEDVGTRLIAISSRFGTLFGASCEARAVPPAKAGPTGRRWVMHLCIPKMPQSHQENPPKSAELSARSFWHRETVARLADHVRMAFREGQRPSAGG